MPATQARGPHLERAKEPVENCLSLRVEALQLADVPVLQRWVVIEWLELAVMQSSGVFFYILVLQHPPGQPGACKHNKTMAGGEKGVVSRRTERCGRSV